MGEYDPQTSHRRRGKQRLLKSKLSFDMMAIGLRHWYRSTRMGPTALEVEHGDVLIQPFFVGKRSHRQNPRLPWRTQHDFANDTVGRPWVVSVEPRFIQAEVRTALKHVVGTKAIAHLPKSGVTKPTSIVLRKHSLVAPQTDRLRPCPSVHAQEQTTQPFNNSSPNARVF